MKRILFLVTNVDRIGPFGRRTGYEFSEVAHPFLAFAAEEFSIDFTSLRRAYLRRTATIPWTQPAWCFETARAFSG